MVHTATATKLTSYLKMLSKRRNTGVVTADDVHSFLSKQGVPNTNWRTRLAYVNASLREPAFQTVGTRKSERPRARSRTIAEWTYNG